MRKLFEIIFIFLLLTYNVLSAQELVATNSIINPPEPTRFGNVNIAYPFDLPNDITKFKPNLSLYYNSEGESSWVGYGFSIGTSLISVDDRWGVPQFNNSLESELYSLDGIQLIYPNDYLPHRHRGDNPNEFDTSLQAKSFDEITVNGEKMKSFQPRRKTIFSKIERFGNSPKNYYWKVSHTNGTIQWFGGDDSYKPSVNGNSDYLIRTLDGNITDWALVKTVDRHGNFIRYTYNKGNYQGLSGENVNLNGGEYLYLSTIHYTGRQDDDGNVIRSPKTKVKFEQYDNTNLRKDVRIYAKSGAKKVDAKKLHKVEIIQNNKMVKTFVFSYSEGEFHKTLLDYITEFNQLEQEVLKHKFDYYKMEEPIYSSYVTIGEKGTGEYENVNTSMPFNLDQITGNSVISRSKSSEWGWEVRPGLGLQVRPFIFPATGHSNRTFTIGSTYGESYSNNIDLLGLIDINGDGLKDLVFKDSSGMKYKPRIKRSGANMFGEVKSINTLGNIGITKGKSRTLFPSSIDFRSKWASFGRKNFKSTSENSVYLVDANADMLVDVVDFDEDGNSIVYFNYLNENGIPTFSPDSSLTPNMLITASPASETEVADPYD